MSQKFATGDIVVLKSGSPKMTVATLLDKQNIHPGYYACQWFSGKKLEYGQFPPDSLRAATQDDK